ncbi:MAG: hypothetical protein M0Q92_11975 [Methanoregula sp.]|jgi:hypothetical protein|nr:hypothetical protein [Methanoregula sp.]
MAMTEKTKEQPDHGRIIRITVLLTLGALFFLIIWIWKSESLFDMNIYDGFLLLVSLALSGILAGIYFQYRKTGEPYVLVIFGTVVIAIWLFLIIPLGSLAYLATSPGYYEYRISTEGLDQYQGGLITDIIVPLPEKNGKSIIPEEYFQYRRFGNWTSLLVITPQGKMLAFQSRDKNLTDIDAHFVVPLERPAIFQGNPGNLLQPVIDQKAGIYTVWENDSQTAVYTSQIYIDKKTKFALPGDTPIRIELNLVFHEGMVFGRYGESYRLRVLEKIPGGITGMVPVNVRITKNPDLSAIKVSHTEGAAFNGTTAGLQLSGPVGNGPLSDPGPVPNIGSGSIITNASYVARIALDDERVKEMLRHNSTL